MNVSQKEELGILVFPGDARLKVFEDIEFREIGLRLVQIFQVLPTPTESLSLLVFDTFGVYFSFPKNVFVLGGEILADHRHDSNFCEIARSQREIGARAAQNIGGAAR